MDGNRCISEIWIDETVLVTSLTSSGANMQGTNSVVVHCSRGSKVYVQNNALYSCRHFDNAEYEGMATFSGFLLASDDGPK